MRSHHPWQPQPSTQSRFYRQTTMGYLSRVETNTFRKRYAAVLATYSIEPADAYNTAAPADVVWLIYATTKEGVTTVFLKWNQEVRGGGGGARISHSFNQCLTMSQ